jgi:hypothetical protein
MKIEFKGDTFTCPDAAATVAAGVLSVPVDKLVFVDVAEAQAAFDAAKVERDAIKALTNADVLAWAALQPDNPRLQIDWAEAKLDAAKRALADAKLVAKKLVT